MSHSNLQGLKHQLRAYKKKYYTNRLLRGSILFLASFSAVYLVTTSLESVGHFGPAVRSIMFFALVGAGLFAFVGWIGFPVKQLLNLDRELSDAEASKQIGEFFPEVKDKLLNTLQLENASGNRELLEASLAQKTQELSAVPFLTAVDYKENKRPFMRYFLAPASILLLLLLFTPQLLIKSTERLVNYEREYLPEAPFTFALKNNSTEVFRNEDYTVELEIEPKNGNDVPNEVYLVSNGRRRKLKKDGLTKFSYTLPKVSEDQDFHFESAGFGSQQYHLTVRYRPQLDQLKAQLDYPAYLGKKDEQLSNAGALTVPEGTKIQWTAKVRDTEKLLVSFSEGAIEATKEGDDKFTFGKTFTKTERYGVSLKNPHGKNKDEISYSVNVIKDQYPSISLEHYDDTLLFQYIIVGGQVSDDYGISKCRLFYRIQRDGKGKGKFQSQAIPIDKGRARQTFFYQLKTADLDLKAGDKLEYFVKVWDNDAPHGFKARSSSQRIMELPSEKQLKEEMDASNAETEQDIDNALQKAQEVRKELKEVQDKLKSKKKLDWQDKKAVDKLVEKHKELEEELKKFKEQYQQNNQRKDQFQQESEELQKKVEQINKLMEELMDEETKKLMEELQKLMEEYQKQNPDEIQKALDQLQQKDETLENELDRTLELFKQLKFEQKMEQTINELEKLGEEQEQLSEETKEAKGKEQQEELKQKQEELSEKFDQLQKEMEQLEKMNKELQRPNDMGDNSQQQQDIDQEQQQSQESLEKGKNSKASESQKNAGQKMKQMAQQMQQQMQAGQMQQATEDLDNIRNILEGLITMSFEQERIMKEFKSVRQADPRFVTLSQEQLKLDDDFRVLEDSLLALSKRVFQIESYITKELSALKSHMGKTVEEIRARRAYRAAGEQQYVMTHTNNLALLLDEVMQQMQQQMAQQMSGNQMCQKPGNSQGNKKGNKPGQKPGLSDQQKQLNDMIKQLKSGQKTGRQLSEDLMKMATQQEAIRRALKEMEEGAVGKEGAELRKKLQELRKVMEETEKDIVYNRINDRTIQRQSEIQTRLLEAEKAAREQKEDKKREATTAQQKERPLPPSYEEYLRQKAKQVELLQTIPPSLTPYFKKETNEYFDLLEK